jgi:hypothetical protein
MTRTERMELWDTPQREAAVVMARRLEAMEQRLRDLEQG